MDGTVAAIQMKINNVHQYKTDDDRYFRTASFYAAAFLFAKDVVLVNIEKTENTRSRFVFHDTPERELLLESFHFAKPNAEEVMVDARKFATAIRQLKEQLYQGRF